MSKPSPSSPCFGYGPSWPDRPLAVDRIEVTENTDGTYTGVAYVNDEAVATKIVTAADVWWQTDETPPRVFRDRARAEARDQARAGSNN